MPSFFLSAYHYFLATLANVYYRHPSEKMIIIGVTGTNGKTTVTHLISALLEKAGYKVGLTSSVNFKVGANIQKNSLKMTMPGRFFLQKLLRKMANAGCDYAIIEVTSEGIRQFRHKGINFDIGIFTNLTPEHIESHGGFENYKKAKLEFFNHLSKNGHKTINGKIVNKVLIVNNDDKYTEEFLKFNIEQKYVYGLKPRDNQQNAIIATNCELSNGKTSFSIKNHIFNLKLLGEFNVYNALAAITAGVSQNIDMEIIKKTIAEIQNIPGRMEFIEIGQPFKVIVDYAHTPDALCKVYETLQSANSQLICVLGSAGGGRDRWKRPEMGKIAAQYCNQIILTNEDPYNENPEKIIDEINSKIPQNSMPTGRQANYQKILDRREAVKTALMSARPNDTVIITGKGAENKMMVKNGWIQWDDREVVKEELKKIYSHLLP
ncbi:MAG: UDP-N-acetylmuramoyl-L-alanyl-D-glutamate--2,6-diaminopimelate ligase [Patescibacteria group bacterium]